MTHYPRLQDFHEIREHMRRGNLLITPSNCDDLKNFARLNRDLFQRFNKGVLIKEWRTSHDPEKLKELLFCFAKLSKVVVEMEWDVVEVDIWDVICRGSQFYDNLLELKISGCKLNDKLMQDIIESVLSPRALVSLDISDTHISETTLSMIRQKFVNISDLKLFCDVTAPTECGAPIPNPVTNEEHSNREHSSILGGNGNEVQRNGDNDIIKWIIVSSIVAIVLITLSSHNGIIPSMDVGRFGINPRITTVPNTCNDEIQNLKERIQILEEQEKMRPRHDIDRFMESPQESNISIASDNIKYEPSILEITKKEPDDIETRTNPFHFNKNVWDILFGTVFVSLVLLICHQV